ncbi:3-oxoadipate enol-lactonase [Syntrophobacter fumaroxidans]|uniref:3-oxoadipate enol-lactonase n=1 Tax=Syntrophobacter fumaroxidans (strain DSM 10017 / MPOB) TaxID=335543 RepID=A0LMJ6_SYNFM|nr:3-oxoadipate enol-lactonase [Syntrophobacter fumaroxidans]ABK18648.1 3-oxoadipate enol-lactonase [Syntrophobacter fumaroxidans MPOB]ABK18690.1 3-oxoadipate enol-lactonase [Syntrophobacter fumaroxidans MPOB]
MRVRVNDVLIRYEMQGPPGAPVVTFSHSLAAALESWDLQLPPLRDAYRVLRMDTRGHGGSSAPPGPYTMEMLSSDVIGLLDHLDIARTHFVGLSLGGMIGQVLAVGYPERLDRLVLCDTSNRMPSETAPVWEERIRTAETQGMTALARETLERWFSEAFRRDQPQATERIRNMIVRTPVAGYTGCCRAISRFDLSGELSRVKVPTLIMVGEKDEGTPVSAAETIQRQIEGSELFVIPGALHLSNIEGAAHFNRRLLSFLS